MKKTTKRLVPAKPAHYEDETEIRCDVCGAEIDYTDNPEIEIKRVNRWPDSGGSGDLVLFDCCAACFDKKVQPALVKIGFTPRKEDF